ncbi:hypothetical protein [Candidatus Mycoplasma haematominutum]|uniref:Uncharacterized protein n=1 Tax=Candidatus Mycoplasma haematominutum 'Birmingham 1' TaxID=1116213 RepID=G8C3C2_9MOLU|nr:hypothetical protein [Candidatus Mycoplasma haematominutum]CCE66820.1 hypothetical protein MHM_03020 [Candidatus Mycoplasma haematominutum 'Birmingham 1']
MSRKEPELQLSIVDDDNQLSRREREYFFESDRVRAESLRTWKIHLTIVVSVALLISAAALIYVFAKG